MPEASVPRPFRVGDLCDELGLEPHRVLALWSRHLLEGRGSAHERPELARQRIEVGPVEAGADLAGIDKLVALEGPEQKRGEGLSLDPRAAIAADDELFAAKAFDLEPVLAPARAVRRVRPLGHDAFEPRGAGLCEELESGAFHIIRIDEPVGDTSGRHQFGEKRAPLLERLLAQVLAVKRQQIEDEIADGRVRCVDMLLQRFEVGDA